MRHPAASLALLAGVGLLAAGCAPLRSHQGYIVDADLVNSVQPGVDTRDSVRQVLGTPTLQSAFSADGGGDYYYFARDSRNYGFQTPHAREQITLQISFDSSGTVSAIRRSGIEQVADVDVYGKKTPTLGRQRGFFEDLFGNIGQVGTAGGPGGGGVGGGTSPNGGGR